MSAPRRNLGLAMACLTLALGACTAPARPDLHTIGWVTKGEASSSDSVTTLSAPPATASQPAMFGPAPAAQSITSAMKMPGVAAAKSAPSATATLPTTVTRIQDNAPEPAGAVVRTSAEIPVAPTPPELPPELPPVVGGGETSRSMTLDEAQKYAAEHHPTLRARRQEIQVAQGKLIAAGTMINPQLTVDYDVPVDQHEGSQITANLIFDLPTANKIPLAKSVAESDICRARSLLNQAAETLRQQVGDAATGVFYLQEMLTIYERLSAIAAKQAEIQKGRFDAAQAPYADVIQAEVVAKDMELRRLDTAMQLDTAALTFARTIGLPPPQRVRLQGRIEIEPLPRVPVERILAMTEKNAPNIATAQISVAGSQRQFDLARAKAVPDLQIGSRAQMVPGNIANDTIAGIGTVLGGRDALGGRLKFDVPMFDRNQGGIYGSAAQIEVNRALLDEAKLTTLGDAAAAYEELRSLESRMHYYETQVLAVADKTEATLKNDEVTRAMPPLQMVNMLEEFLRIRVTYVQLRYRYRTLYSHLEQFIGCRLVEL